jgi:hypothetical protein
LAACSGVALRQQRLELGKRLPGDGNGRELLEVDRQPASSPRSTRNPHENRADQEVIKAWDPNALEKVDYALSVGFAVSSRNGFIRCLSEIVFRIDG